MHALTAPRPSTSGILGPWPLLTRPSFDLRGLPPLLAVAGSLELRLASTEREVAKAQRLRYREFFERGPATPSRPASLLRLDRCLFDAEADHLIVVDTDFITRRGRRKRKVVGTYRLIGSEAAARGPGFYSATEFDLAPLLERHSGLRFLELGRSCVDARYRARRVVNLLWRGIGIYAAHHGIDALIGCASLPGTDMARLSGQIGVIGQVAGADLAWRVYPRQGRGVGLVHRLPEAEEAAVAVLRSLPPLVKAYLRAGSRFSPDPVIDPEFGCTDLFTVLPLATAARRYLAEFGAPSA